VRPPLYIHGFMSTLSRLIELIDCSSDVAVVKPPCS
jgi:hypothetical protein